MNRALNRLQPDTLLLLGYLLGLAVYWLLVDTEPPEPWDDQTIRLGEDHLRRLENGDSVAIERWHGHRLHLEGALEIDADALEPGHADETDA